MFMGEYNDIIIIVLLRYLIFTFTIISSYSVIV